LRSLALSTLKVEISGTPNYVDDKLHQNLAPYRSALMAGEAAGYGRRDFDLELEIRSGLRRWRGRR
jgi:hypothetical protein